MEKEEYKLLRIADYEEISEANDDSIYLLIQKKDQNDLFLECKKARIWNKKENWITFFLVIALGIIISYLITYGRDEILKGIGRYWDFLYQLSIAYLASTIFYLMTVRIPDTHKEKRLNKAIIIREKEILYNMKCVLSEVLSEKMMCSSIESIDIDVGKSIYIDFNNRSSIADISCIGSSKKEYLTICRYIYGRVKEIKKQTEDLLTVYHDNLPSDTICLLENVRNAFLHTDELFCVIDKEPKLVFDKRDGVFDQYINLINSLSNEIKTITSD